MPPLVVQPTVVPRFVPRTVPQVLQVRSRTSINWKTISVFDPIIVLRPVGKRRATTIVKPAYHSYEPKSPEHFPLPRVVLVPRLVRAPRLPNRPITATSILQPDAERYTKPWDLIAACIAWLRSKPEITAAFGDAPTSASTTKFVSDLELPTSKMPYAIFSEPMEHETYETPDQTGRFSSLVTGYFVITVLWTEKQTSRKLADLVAASLQDAPLVFTDGVLMYLRRSERRSPIVTTPGADEEGTRYKRIIEFEYRIERFF